MTNTETNDITIECSEDSTALDLPEELREISASTKGRIDSIQTDKGIQDSFIKGNQTIADNADRAIKSIEPKLDSATSIEQLALYRQGNITKYNKANNTLHTAINEETTAFSEANKEDIDNRLKQITNKRKDALDDKDVAGTNLKDAKEAFNKLDKTPKDPDICGLHISAPHITGCRTNINIENSKRKKAEEDAKNVVTWAEKVLAFHAAQKIFNDSAASKKTSESAFTTFLGQEVFSSDEFKNLRESQNDPDKSLTEATTIKQSLGESLTAKETAKFSAKQNVKTSSEDAETLLSSLKDQAKEYLQNSIAIMKYFKEQARAEGVTKSKAKSHSDAAYKEKTEVASLMKQLGIDQDQDIQDLLKQENRLSSGIMAFVKNMDENDISGDVEEVNSHYVQV